MREWGMKKGIKGKREGKNEIKGEWGGWVEGVNSHIEVLNGLLNILLNP